MYVKEHEVILNLTDQLVKMIGEDEAVRAANSLKKIAVALEDVLGGRQDGSFCDDSV